MSLSSKPQAYRSAYNETIASPKHGLQRVVRPPNEAIVESKRSQLIEDAEEELELEMNKLEEDSHAYNLEIQRRIDAVKHQAGLLEQRIDQEEHAMLESIQALQQSFTKRFQQEFVQFEQKMYAHWNRVETQQVTLQEKQIKEQEQELQVFYKETVPRIMEQLQGTITRKLEKNHETFDIENAKIQKREKKTMGILDTSEKNASIWFTTEHERKHVKFQEIHEALHHEMKLIGRAKELEQQQIVQTIVSLRQQLAALTTVRNAEDLQMLQQIASGFQHLQSSILENLGEQIDTEPPNRHRRKSSTTVPRHNKSVTAAIAGAAGGAASGGGAATITTTTTTTATDIYTPDPVTTEPSPPVVPTASPAATSAPAAAANARVGANAKATK